MKRNVTRTKITSEIKNIIGLLWISYAKELEQNPKRKFKIQELLEIVNREIKSRKLREKISSSQLYVEIAQLRANKENIDGFKDNPFSIGIFINKYNNQVDANSLSAILQLIRVKSSGKSKVVMTNRQAFWVSRLYQVYQSIKQEDEHKYWSFLWLISSLYSEQELLSEITGITLNTADLDNALLEKKYVDEILEIAESFNDKNHLDKKYEVIFKRISRPLTNIEWAKVQ
jgi:hypothetical protein